MSKEINKSSWKEELKMLKLDRLKSATPEAFEASGAYTMKIRRYKDTSANELTRSVIDWINFHGGMANRINVQGQVRKEKVELAFGNGREIITYTPSTTNKGTSDIVGLINSQYVGIEIKIGRDVLSLHQLREKERITKAGGLYFVARDMQSFVDWYKRNFTAS